MADDDKKPPAPGEEQNQPPPEGDAPPSGKASKAAPTVDKPRPPSPPNRERIVRPVMYDVHDSRDGEITWDTTPLPQPGDFICRTTQDPRYRAYPDGTQPPKASQIQKPAICTEVKNGKLIRAVWRGRINGNAVSNTVKHAVDQGILAEILLV